MEWDSSSWLDFGNVWYSIENEKTICYNKDSPMMSLAQYQRCYDLMEKLKWNKNIFNFIIKNKKFEIIDKLILESKLDFLYFIKNSNLKLQNTTNNLLKSKIILEEKRLKYISSKNHLSGFPSKLSKKIDFIKNTLIKNFEFDKKYSEDEVNEIIYVYGLDNCEAKKEMVSLNFLNRTLDGSKYWRVK